MQGIFVSPSQGEVDWSIGDPGEPSVTRLCNHDPWGGIVSDNIISVGSVVSDNIIVVGGVVSDNSTRGGSVVQYV